MILRELGQEMLKVLDAVTDNSEECALVVFQRLILLMLDIRRLGKFDN